MVRYWFLICLAAAVTIPAIFLRIIGVNPAQPVINAASFGIAIVGGAFLLTWAAEVAEMDISQGLALAFLALVAVLPEYAVDLYFAWKAAAHPEYTAYAAANMTGANRLLIGIAWPLIVLLCWVRGRTEPKLNAGTMSGALPRSHASRRRLERWRLLSVSGKVSRSEEITAHPEEAAPKQARSFRAASKGSQRPSRRVLAEQAPPYLAGTVLKLPATRAVELVFLALATMYSFVIPLKGTISLVDTVVLIGIFAAYMWRIAGAGAEEPDLVGPALALAAFRPAPRRAAIVGIFLFSAAVILGSAEPFAEALIGIGRHSGIDEFLLVQWLAPLASEAPEVVIACILTLKGNAQAGMGAMVSAKVNQWTLLVGTLPVVYSAGLLGPGALHLDSRQVEEIALTAAQSLFAVAVLCRLRLSIFEAFVLFVLFASQLLIPSQTVRYGFALTYAVLGVATLVRSRQALSGLLHAGLRAPL
jgi:cation:H+ antiporter